jgi:hypothetical protein
MLLEPQTAEAAEVDTTALVLLVEVLELELVVLVEIQQMLVLPLAQDMVQVVVERGGLQPQGRQVLLA